MGKSIILLDGINLNKVYILLTVIYKFSVISINPNIILQIQTLNRHKKCVSSLDIRKIQIEATLRVQLTPVRMAHIQKSINNKC